VAPVVLVERVTQAPAALPVRAALRARRVRPVALAFPAAAPRRQEADLQEQPAPELRR
jgi:hypothetical protein